jgi:hypothetical protein
MKMDLGLNTARSFSRQSARLRNLRLRPPKPALGRGRLQRQIRRAFLLGEELCSSQIYDWCYAGCRRPLSTRQRYGVATAGGDGGSCRPGMAWRQCVAPQSG